MAFANFGSDKTNVPFRSEAGARGLVHPTGLPGEVKKPLSGCVGCPKYGDHGPCELIANVITFGETRHQRIDSDEKVRVEDLWKMMTALWVLGYVHHPYDNGLLIYNAGQANNQSQCVDYEVTGASGNTLTLKGRNPKLIVIGNSIMNPDWPFTGGRYLTVDYATSMVLGSQVQFAYPSVLADKLKPFVKKVNLPASDDLENVTFTVELSCSVSSARKPIDLKYPPTDGKYWCRIWWWGLQPEAWPRIDTPEETQFTKRTVTVDVGDLEEGDVFVFKKSDGTNARVLYPGMVATGAVSVAAEVSGIWQWKDDSWAASRLTTTQTGYGAWTSQIELADLIIEHPTATRVRVVFHPEAVVDDTFRMPWASGCANCQRDRSGSYVHHDGWRCTNPNASGFANFKRKCWQPQGKTGTGCSGFGLGYNGDSFGSLASGLDDARQGSLWARLYTRSTWVLEQGMPGVSSSRNFNLRMPSGGGVSLGSLCGGWSDQVPNGYFPSRWQLYGTTHGLREEFEDEDGENHRLVPGLYAARKPWTAGTTPDPGVLPSLVSGWGSRTNALGETMDSRLGMFPSRGAGRTHLYRYEHGGSAFGRGNKLVAGLEAFATGVNPNEVDEEMADSVRARFA